MYKRSLYIGLEEVKSLVLFLCGTKGKEKKETKGKTSSNRYDGGIALDTPPQNYLCHCLLVLFSQTLESIEN